MRAGAKIGEREIALVARGIEHPVTGPDDCRCASLRQRTSSPAVINRFIGS